MRANRASKDRDEVRVVRPSPRVVSDDDIDDIDDDGDDSDDAD